jgi:hypothetical protein
MHHCGRSISGISAGGNFARLRWYVVGFMSVASPGATPFVEAAAGLEPLSRRRFVSSRFSALLDTGFKLAELFAKISKLFVISASIVSYLAPDIWEHFFYQLSKLTFDSAECVFDVVQSVI